MAAKKQQQQEVKAIEIPAINLQEMELRLVGISSLVCHRWSEKAKAQIGGVGGSKAHKKLPPRDPQAEYLASMYPHPDGGYGFPASGFKKAAVSAVRNIDGFTMTLARGAFHVIDDLVKIDGEPQMREDMVRLSKSKPDRRFRGEFTEWSVTLRIVYNADVMSPAQILNLYNIAGFAVGIGEARPEKGGSWGMWRVATEEESKKAA